MAKDFFEGRVQLLHDTEENWQSVANTFIPLPGEACVTLDEENKGRVKYGDGLHTWGELPYSNDGHYDGKTIVSDNHVIQLKGFKDASDGQVPSKTSEGLEWFTPVKTVFIGDDEHPVEPTDGNIIIPIAGENLGVVKESEEIGVSEEGSMILKEVGVDKVKYDEENSIKDVLDKRTSWEHF